MEEMQMKAQLAIINGESIMSSGEYTVKEWDNIRKERLESDRTRMRFEAAVAALQGLLSGELNDSGFESVAEDAVKYADALLERLEE
jgi:hypothetical protein